MMTPRNELTFLCSAKFLKLEQLDQEATLPVDTPGVSIDGTGQVGTYFYTAPEIEQGWPKIDEKVRTVTHTAVFSFFMHLYIFAELLIYYLITGRYVQSRSCLF